MRVEMIVAVFIGALAILLAAGWLVTRLLTYKSRPPLNLRENGGFSLARYQPLASLLAEDDFKFLASLPGYRPEIGKKLRSQRRRIFRQYLQELTADFRSLHAAAREMAADSPEQHSELVGILMRQQLTFWRAMAGIELRLAADWMGLNGSGKIDARGLLEGIEAMRLDLSRLAAPA